MTHRFYQAVDMCGNPIQTVFAEDDDKAREEIMERLNDADLLHVGFGLSWAQSGYHIQEMFQRF